MFFQLDIPETVKMVHEIHKSGVLSRPVEPIRKPAKKTPAQRKAEMVADLLATREHLHADITRRIDAMAGTQWLADRINEMEWINRDLDRLGYKPE
jgi:hypothetical protein